jgi:OFA family oxalate/formate antiporter-like MFS transporter
MMPKEKNNPGLFYGWLTMGACFAVMLIQGGTMWTFGVFLKPIAQDFYWSRAQASSGYTAFLIGYVISVMAAGRLADRYSPGPILLVSAIIIGVGFSLCSKVHTINHLRMFLFVGGLGSGANWSVPTSTVQRWFFMRERAGLALGITISGVGVGALLFALLGNYLVSSHGWRDAYLTFGITFFAIMAASSFVVKPRPSETSVLSDRAGAALNLPNVHPRTRREVLMSLSFAAITFCHCITLAAFQIISAHLVPYATDIGIPSTASAAAIGLLGAFSIPGRIISGYLSARIQWQRILAFSHFGMGLFMLLLLFLQGTWLLYCFVFFYGLCHGSRVSAYLGILGDFFGMGSLGELIGITMAIGIFTGAFAPYLAGFLFDITGNYLSVFTIMMVLLLGGGIIASIVRKPKAAQ